MAESESRVAAAVRRATCHTAILDQRLARAWSIIDRQQAKKWADPVQRPAVQGFVGALTGASASKGIMFRASSFTKGAEDYAANVALRVILIDGPRLAGLMIDHDVGVSTRDVLRLKDIDSDYFSDDA